jgi:hypothetical protein
MPNPACVLYNAYRQALLDHPDTVTVPPYWNDLSAAEQCAWFDVVAVSVRFYAEHKQ